MTAPDESQSPRPVAAVITEWRKNSHADVILSRLLDPAAWGHTKSFNLKLAAVYADQFPDRDLAREYCGKHGVPIFPTVKGAIGVGGGKVGVEGVLLIGEHGDYARNGRRQHMYPRRRLFDEVVNAFRALGGRAPVFSDKHLSYEWEFCRWMYDVARHEGIPFMAGSSLPVAWRVPDLNPPMGARIVSALSLGYGDLDAYGFHALETLQCMTERRLGGETGVASVRCLLPHEVWPAAKRGEWPSELIEPLLPARLRINPKAKAPVPTNRDHVFLIEYADGLKAATAMLGSIGACFAYSGRREGGAVDSAVFDLDESPRFGHFGYLLRAIDDMVRTGKPSYPIERTLLTSGMLSALFQSLAEGGRSIKTPHLAEIRYRPVDRPHALGVTGTPA